LKTEYGIISADYRVFFIKFDACKINNLAQLKQVFPFNFLQHDTAHRSKLLKEGSHNYLVISEGVNVDLSGGFGILI
jgi:hypothetical protein